MQNTTMKIIFNNRREKSITARVSNMAIPAGKSVLLGGGGATMTILQQIRGSLRLNSM